LSLLVTSKTSLVSTSTLSVYAFRWILYVWIGIYHGEIVGLMNIPSPVQLI